MFNQEKKHDIRLSQPKENITIKADKDRITSVFNNLMTNAIQSIPEGKKGIIEVTVLKEKKWAQISIKDNGVGIPNEEIDRIFEPNFTTKSSGTGLGLAMVKNTITNIGGKITVNSTLNKGSTFILNLPIEKN